MRLTFTIFLLVTFTTTFQVGLGKAQVPVPVSYLDSLKWRQLAAEAGNVTAQFQLGQILDLGLTAEPNQKEAANWYTKAAEQGHVEAQIRLAQMYYSGEGIARDLTQSSKWYGTAAKAGIPLAQFNFAVMLEAGAGV
ncbi:MAG TPA: sel1 repeat family protein, partial [Rhodospirillales bacterium]|nr:sel1 repeat family protein [Rhodospirillales bacterium]